MKQMINSNSNSSNNSNIQCTTIIETFKYILEPLVHTGWRIINANAVSSSTKIIMNKKYEELKEIHIEYKNSYYHFSLPINNSIYSYYNKIGDEEQSVQFLTSFINQID